MKIKQNIPNFLTCCNLLCGCLAIVCAFEGNLVWSAYLVGIAAVFDFFDGFAARMLGVSSPIGKDLDSLADMVTFGVVPGIVVYKILDFIFPNTGWVIYPPLSALPEGEYNLYNLIKYVGLIIPIFSALRLAKFNNDSRQTDSFIGLPTPANAIFFCSFPLIQNFEVLNALKEMNEKFIEEGLGEVDTTTGINSYMIQPYIFIPLIFIFSFLLISELPLFALKFKSFDWKGNEIRYVFLGLSLVLLITLKFIGIPLIIILYILLSVINNVFFKTKSPLEGA